MKRTKGDLPGRYVPPHVRKWPNRPGEFVPVSEYQERTEPAAAPVENTHRQGELDLGVGSVPEKDADEA